MVLRTLVAATATISLLGFPRANGDDVRYVEQGGALYRETRRVVQRPVVETRVEESTRTVYREEFATEMRDTVRTCQTPVTEYRCEPYVLNRWNPFATPQIAYRMVPHTRWDSRTETVKVPVTCRRLVPTTETVRRPVTTCRMVADEVTTRVAVRGPSPAATRFSQPASQPRYEEIGGIARLDRKDPPRQGMSTAWRPASTLR